MYIHNGWVNNGWMNRWITDGWTYRWMDKWWMNGWMNGQNDRMIDSVNFISISH